MNRTFVSLVGAGLMTAGLLSSCAKTADKAKDSLDKGSQKAAVVDQWESACGPAPLLSKIVGLDSTRELVDLGTGMALTTTYFLDGACATAPDVTVVESGSYDVGNKTANENFLFDARVETVTVVANTDNGRDKLNGILGAGFCGINDWQTGQPRDVTTNSQNSSPIAPCVAQAPRNIYDVERVDGDQLKFGLVENGLDKSAADKRPANIDQARVYTRK